MKRVRQYRGISTRAALRYLEGLGGERTGEAAVEGDGWHASVTDDTVTVGPTLELTELTVRFEGDEARLDRLVEEFSQKAMRAGG